ncbi:MAG: AMP-binding protein [Schwartzia sp.]|nr:AMP-binding protein [Schwartzia sp. (in: firmicutes)]
MLVHDLIWRGRPEDVAIYDQGRALTYRALILSVTLCRSRLYADGVRLHDHVAIFSHNCAEYIIAYMALTSLGAVVVPINFQFSAREIGFILKNADIHYLITDREIELEGAINGYEHENVRQVLITECTKPVQHASAPALPEDFGADEPCTIIYTSGTTGWPKGAVLSHKNLVMNAIALQQVVRLTRKDNILCVLPMYHCFSWTCAVLNELYTGSAITILDSFLPKKLIATVREFRVTVIVMIPSICSLLVKMATGDDFATLRFVMLGGMPLPRQIGEAFLAKFRIPLIEGYGLSEASPVVTMNAPDAARLGSVGPVIPDVRIRVVDTNGHDLPQGEIGELWVQGPNVMHGYWGLPEATAEALRDGWLHTGDLARVDADGYVYIMGRLKDMIISMGENVYPREIEELLYAYPGIREAAVIAIDDPLRGQACCCYYSLLPDASVNMATLKKYLQKNLAAFKIPREFYLLEDLPKSSTGKIQKNKLREIYDSTPKPKKV